MAPVLYMLQGSSPSRAVLMTAKSLNLELDLKPVDLTKFEHMTPEFLKFNPQHTIPVLVEEDGFKLKDSHAINAYLVSKYGKDDSLYPKDLKKRALVDEKLHFDNGVAWARALNILKPIIYHGKKTIDESDIKATHEIYGFIESFLESPWIAGETVTIADYSIISTFTALDVVVKIESNRYPKLVKYLENGKALDVYQEVSKEGQEIFRALVTSLLNLK